MFDSGLRYQPCSAVSHWQPSSSPLATRAFLPLVPPLSAQSRAHNVSSRKAPSASASGRHAQPVWPRRASSARRSISHSVRGLCEGGKASASGPGTRGERGGNGYSRGSPLGYPFDHPQPRAASSINGNRALRADAILFSNQDSGLIGRATRRRRGEVLLSRGVDYGTRPSLTSP